MMEEHATIFYIAEKGYALAYDEDWSDLQDYTGDYDVHTPSFLLHPVKDRSSDLFYMRIAYYRPLDDEREDRFVVVTPMWLARVLLQFIEAYPNGIPDAVLKANYFKHIERRRNKVPELVSKDDMFAIMSTPKSERKRQKRFHRKSRAQDWSAYI